MMRCWYVKPAEPASTAAIHSSRIPTRFTQVVPPTATHITTVAPERSTPAGVASCDLGSTATVDMPRTAAIIQPPMARLTLSELVESVEPPCALMAEATL